jgi:hypothetical protein
MKFAVLAALFATADARSAPRSAEGRGSQSRRSHRGLEEDLTENVRVHYPAETVQGFMGMMGELNTLGEEAEASLHREWPTMERDMRNIGRWASQRYGQDAMTYAHSSSVRAAMTHKEAMARTSSELHTVMSDAFTLYSEFAHG